MTSGKKHRAKQLFVEALDILTAAFGPHDHRLVSPLTSLGVYYRDDDPDRAKEWLERALTLNHERISPGIPWQPIVYDGAPLTEGLEDDKSMNLLKFLGTVYKNLGEFENAKKLLETHLRILETVVDPTHPDVAVALKLLGEVYKRLEDIPNARRVFERGLRIQTQTYGPDSLRVARILNHLSWIEIREGNTPRAIQMLEKVVEIFEEELGPEHSDTRTTQMRLNSLMDDQ